MEKFINIVNGHINNPRWEVCKGEKLQLHFLLADVIVGGCVYFLPSSIFVARWVHVF